MNIESFIGTHSSTMEFEAIKQHWNTDKHNMRMIYIQRIFNYNKFIGIEDKQLSRNPYYFNDTFDYLYGLNFYDLEDLDQQLHGLSETYSRIMARNNSEGDE